MESEWWWDDFMIGKLEAKLLDLGVNLRLANEDRDPEFYLAELVDEHGLPRGSGLTAALRRLTDRGWLQSWMESTGVADAEQRPARRYYVLTDAGAEAAEVLMGKEHGWIPRNSKAAPERRPPPPRVKRKRKQGPRKAKK